jgi:hypothetical protein
MSNSNTSMQPEQSFQRSFSPLTSKKDGKAQLTYAGYQHSINLNGGAFLKIIFSVLDVTGKNSQNISILSSYRYSERNVLGRLLKTMGYEHKVDEVVINPDDDEFGHGIDENLDAIYDFLDEKKGLVFKGFCQVPEGETFYRIYVDSIVVCLNKNGTQKQVDAMREISNESLVVDIEAEGGDVEDKSGDVETEGKDKK